MKLTLDTPEVENKTTTTVKIHDVNIIGMLEENGPVAIIGVTEGEIVESEFIVHRTKSCRIEKAILDVELAKTCNGTDTNSVCIERAIFDALVAAGHVATGTLT